MSVTEGVGKLHTETSSGSFTLYRLLCGCGDPQCDLSLSVDYDVETNNVEVVFEASLLSLTPDHSEWPWYRSIWNRVKHACRILFTGSTRAEYSLYVPTCDHVYAIIGALLEARRRMQQAGKPFRQAGRLEDK